MRRQAAFVAFLAVQPLLFGAPGRAVADKPNSPQHLAGQINELLNAHWKSHDVQPAAPADDAAFLRRITLDLAGRLPTPQEVERFLADNSKDKRQRAIQTLIAGPEFPLHFGNVLDRMIQGRYAGDPEFIDYLRRSLRDGKSWDGMFRQMMLGPWETAQQKPATRFLSKRTKQLDRLTADAARVFFGVDISCAKCHDHPLVEDWTQRHFYGMASFFNRTTGGRGKIREKSKGEVTYLGPDGKETTAEVMFLNGRVVREPKKSSKSAKTKSAKKPVIRRAQLVRVALEDRRFFSRSFVNRMWQYLFGRGLVEPVDQMHSANPPAVPGVLERLAEDFAQNGYDIRRLITAIVSTRAYQLSSRWNRETPVPDPSLFAVAQLRPLSRRQFAFALLQATGNARLRETDDSKERLERYVGVTGLSRIEDYLRIEREAAEWMDQIDPRIAAFQSSSDEALFLSNHEAIQKLIAADGDNLAARLSRPSDTRETVQTAVRAVFRRPPEPEETERLVKWFNAQQNENRTATCEQLVWALVTSAEFRFNH